MNKWEIIFYPSEGERHSPIDTLNNTLRSAEQANIQHRLNVLRKLEMSEWPYKWVKLVNTIYQLTAGNFRVYFGIVDRTMVVCYICRKVSQKALKEDLDRAIYNFNDYLDYESGTK